MQPVDDRTVVDYRVCFALDQGHAHRTGHTDEPEPAGGNDVGYIFARLGLNDDAVGSGRFELRSGSDGAVEHAGKPLLPPSASTWADAPIVASVSFVTIMTPHGPADPTNPPAKPRTTRGHEYRPERKQTRPAGITRWLNCRWSRRPGCRC